MNIDNQDLVSKMEGFSVQGMQGAAKDHQKHSSAIQSAICDKINKALHKSSLSILGKITKDLKARMHWAHYWHNVIQWYHVMVEGWPNNILFVNLSSISSPLPDLEMLLCKWQSHVIHWRCIEEVKYEKLLQECNKKLE
ncbi:hypothetical protein EDD22DRAFT_785582 [Suillus occidentalis]|nr:hypothetical protein EDD22DRAFT_785582 [Suillus occidentalis]